MTMVAQPAWANAYAGQSLTKKRVPPHVSKLAEWYMTFCFALLVLEGFSLPLLDFTLFEKAAWYARITPWSLPPSILYFYSIGFLIALGIFFGARRSWQVSVRGAFIWSLYVSAYTFSMFHGFLRNNVAWFSEMRWMLLPAFVAPWVVVLAQFVRMDVVLTRIIWLTVPLAAINIVRGAMFIVTGTRLEASLMGLSWKCDYMLMIAYSAALSRLVTGNKTNMFSVLVLGMGLVAPLEKPTLATFAMVNFGVIFMALRSGLAIKGDNIIKVAGGICVVGVIGAVFMNAMLSVGQGSGKAYLLNRIFKYDQGQTRRDVSGGRFRIWGDAIEQWQESPFVGKGMGARVDGNEGIKMGVTMHNYFIAALFQGGVVSLTVVAICVLTLVFRTLATTARGTPGLDWARIGIIGWAFGILCACAYADSLSPRCIVFAFWFALSIEAVAQSRVIERWYETSPYSGYTPESVDPNYLAYAGYGTQYPQASQQPQTGQRGQFARYRVGRTFPSRRT